MELLTGRLVEISPLGTGFIEDLSGARYGFHRAMLPSAQTPAHPNWREVLEGRLVNFQINDGRVVSLQFISAKAAF
jgi:hypothetical protein